MEKQEKNTVTPYDLDGRPPLKLAIPLGLQHVLAMFVGNLTPLLFITAACGIEAGGELQVALLQNAMLIAGIVTLVQVFTVGPVGGKLPIVMGTSSGFIGVCQSVAGVMGNGVVAYGAIMAASFIGGLFETVLGSFLKPLRTLLHPTILRQKTMQKLQLLPRQLPQIRKITLYPFRRSPAINTMMKTENVLPAGVPLKAWKISAKTVNISVSTSRTVLLTTEKRTWRSSPLTPKNMPSTQQVKCRPASSPSGSLTVQLPITTLTKKVL